MLKNLHLLPKYIIEDYNMFYYQNEFLLCLDVLAEKLYEYNLNITEDEHKTFMKLLDLMKVEKEKYDFLKELLY